MTEQNNYFDPTVELDMSDAQPLARTSANFEITKTDTRPTRAKNGTLVEVAFSSLEEIDGVQGWSMSEYFTVVHPNPGVVKGSKRKLAQLLAAAGVSTVVELEGKIVGATVWEKEGDRGLDRKISGFTSPYSTDGDAEVPTVSL